MKKAQKIFISLILILAVASAAVLLLIADFSVVEKDPHIFESPLKISNLAQSQTSLTPILKFALGTVNEIKLYETLEDNQQFEFKGKKSFYLFKVEWQEGHSDINYELTFQKHDGEEYKTIDVDNTYDSNNVSFINRIQDAGKYKVIVSLPVDKQTDFVLTKSEFLFEITPRPIELESEPLVEFTYNKKHQEPNVKAKSGALDNVVVAINNIKKYNSQTNKFEPVPVNDEGKQETITVGTYQCNVNINSSPNYIITNSEVVKDNVITYKILPKPISINAELETNIYKAENINYKAPLSLIGVISGDEVNPTYTLTYKEKEVENIKFVGDYTLSATSDNENYVVVDKNLTVHKKKVNVNFEIKNFYPYDGQEKKPKINEEGLIQGDKVSLVVTYSDKEEAPINAGEYLIDAYLKGDNAYNYDLKVETKKFAINKVQYAIEDFDVEIYAIKFIVILDKFEGLNVEFSTDKINWQKDSKIEALPMNDYTVYVKILADINHYEKILSKDVKTGFDPVIFKGYLDSVDLESFSMKDVVNVQEIIRCKKYIAEGDKPSVDYEKLEKIEKEYASYVDKAQNTLNEAIAVSNSLSIKYVTPLALTLFAGLGLAIRRKKHEE